MAWKQKQEAERERKQKEQAAPGGTRSILDEIDKKTAARTQPPEATQPVPTAKFEPKEIAKKSAAPSTGSSMLNKDSAPSNPNLSATQSAPETEANKSSATTTSYAGKLYSPNPFSPFEQH